jgi:hypothetical protein
VVRRDIRLRPGLRANPPTLAPAPSGPTLLLPVFSSCPHARRGGPGRRWLWRRGAAGRHPGRVQWAAGQCRATQRQHGYELDIAQRAHAAIGAPLPALRVVITQIAGTSSRIVSQTTPTSTRRPRPVPSPQPAHWALAKTASATRSRPGRQPHPAHADRWGETIPRP